MSCPPRVGVSTGPLGRGFSCRLLTGESSELEDVRLLFVGDDWAEDHHDVEIQDETGRRLAKARLPEGISGIAGLHGLVGRFLPEDGDGAGVKIGIETDRGPWVAALVASGYQVYAINPLQSARARQGHDVSGAKSNAGDAHVLADLVRTRRSSSASRPRGGARR